MLKFNRLRPSVAVALMAAALPVTVVFGQAAAGDSAATNADTGVGLSEIVVTATKRSENVQNVPITVDVVTQDQIQSRNLTDSSQLVQLTPSLSFVQGPVANSNIFSIRGIGTIANTPGLEPSVGVTIDGVPIARSVGSVAGLVDLSQVEVLNGPQGTVFGKNASAGVIALSTQDPKLNTTEFTGRVSHATFDYTQTSATVNLPMGDTAAVRLSLWNDQHQGDVDAFKLNEKFGDLNSSGARLKLRWDPVDALDLILTGEWTEHHEHGQADTLYEYNQPIFGPLGNAVLADVESYEASQGVHAATNNLETSTTRPDLQTRGSTHNYTLQANYDLGAGYSLTSLSSYRVIQEHDNFEATGTGYPYTVPYAIGDNYVADVDGYNQVSTELRLTSPSTDRLRYVVGLFYFRLLLHDFFPIDSNFQGLPVPYFSVTAAQNIENTNYAGFGEATFDVTPQFRLTAGIRVTHDEDSGALYRNYLRPPPVLIPPLNGPGSGFGPDYLTASTSFTNTSGRVSAQYDVVQDQMIYGTVSRGYKGPGVNFGFDTTAATNANGGIIKPETSLAYELGYKSLWLDKRIRANVSVFDETVDNFQATVRLPGVPAFVEENAKQLRSDGVNLDVDAKVMQGLTLTGAVQYDHARYTSFTNAACYGGQTAAQGCVTNADGSQTQSLNGYPLQTAPRWSGNFTARYEHELSARWRGVLQASDTYFGRAVFNTDADPREVQGGYALANFSVGLQSTDGHVGITAFMNNAFDRYYLSRIGVSQSSEWYVATQTIDAFRSIGVALDVHF